MKYLKFIIMVALFVILWTISVYAVQVSVNGKTIAVNGIIEDGIALVPLRGVFEELGYTVGYDNLTETAYIKSEDTDIVIRNGKYTFTVNNKVIYPSAAQRIIDGTFYIPLRAVAESIGAEVIWDNGTVFINEVTNCISQSTAMEKEAAVFEENSGMLIDYFKNDNLSTTGQKSYIFKNGDGYYFVTAGYENVNISELDEDFKLVNSWDIACDLPLFGGYYFDGSYHYIVTGNNSDDAYSEEPVYKIQQFDSNFNLFHEKNFSAKYTGVKLPFIDQSVEFASNGRYLYIIDSCMRFTADYSEKFQGNYMICIDTRNFNIINKGIVNEIINYTDKLYVGFKAFACDAVDNMIAFCGVATDGSPSVTVKRMTTASFNSTTGVKIHTVYDNDADGAFEVCGFEKMGENYVVVGISRPEYDGKTNKNVFAAVVPEKNIMQLSSKTRWITQNSENSGISISNVKCKKINEGLMVVLWEETQNGSTILKGAEIDGNGLIVKTISPDSYIRLSQCELFYENDYVMWFYSDGSTKTTYLYKVEL